MLTKEIENTLVVYQRVLLEVLNGKNLQKNRTDVCLAIADINKEIEKSQGKEEYLEALAKIKNELFYIKYQIDERL